MKRLISLILCLLLAAALVPAAGAEDIRIIPVEEPETISVVEPEDAEQPEGTPVPNENDYQTEGEFTWYFDGWELFIWGEGNSVLTGGEQFMRHLAPSVVHIATQSGIVRIGDGCFSDNGFVKLQSLYTDPDVKEIGSHAFRDCAKFNRFTGMAVASIGEEAFSGCTALEYVEFQNSCSIAGRAFADCTALQKLLLFGAAGSIAEDAFSGVSATVYVQAEEPSWTEDNMISYGGTLNWSVSLPHILKQPESVIATEGTSVTFEVQAAGPDLKYSWSYFDTTYQTWRSVYDAGRIFSAENYPILHVYFTRCYEDVLRLRCFVRSPSGYVYSDEVSLTIDNGRPKILTQPQKVTALQNSQVSFTVEAEGVETYQWQYKEGGGWYDCATGGFDTPTYSVKATEARNSRLYRCVMTNEVGKMITREVRLTVLPVIKTQPVSCGVKAGHTASFTVAANGATAYQWQYKTPTGSWRNCSTGGCKTDTLSVVGSSFRNGYQYRCKVTTPYCTKTTDAVTLKIVKKPVISSHPSSQTVAVGAKAKFKTVASGEFLSYQWFYRASPTAAWHKCTGTGYDSATLSVRGIARRDGYQYRCKVYNDAGNAWSAIVTLTVK
ncbi:MAG: leucine-rich repeat protein [Oscillospiraceae bacterium]|nr:leucine-rich repeat protein [Oscillospiraceae bacterium]